MNYICRCVFLTAFADTIVTLSHVRRYRRLGIEKGWALRLSYPNFPKTKSYKYTFTLYFFGRSFISFILQNIQYMYSWKPLSLTWSLRYERGEVPRNVCKRALGLRKDWGKLSKKDEQSFSSKRSKCYWKGIFMHMPFAHF